MPVHLTETKCPPLRYGQQLGYSRDWPYMDSKCLRLLATSPRFVMCCSAVEGRRLGAWSPGIWRVNKFPRWWRSNYKRYQLKTQLKIVSFQLASWARLSTTSTGHMYSMYLRDDSFFVPQVHYTACRR